jgi:hypothetical protein
VSNLQLLPPAPLLLVPFQLPAAPVLYQVPLVLFSSALWRSSSHIPRLNIYRLCLSMPDLF